MYNYNNLSDFEFEILCKDIMQKKLGVKLFTFQKGRDGGIDVTDDPKNKKAIIQVKHYINSKYSDLLGTLKKEVQKVKELKPEKYYICCAIKLTAKNKREIMEDVEADDYYGDYDIDDLLKQNMRYNGYYEDIDTESVVDTICDFIKEDVEQEVSEMIGKLPQDILNRIIISKSNVNVERSDVEGYIEGYLQPSEPEYDHHERDYDYGISGEMDVLDCIFK